MWWTGFGGDVKIRDRIGIIADLLLGAVHADQRFEDVERQAVQRLLADLLLTDSLPETLEARIDAFDPATFDLAAAARDFVDDPPMNKRRLMELVAQMCHADDVLDLAEDDYIRALGAALGMPPEEYADLVLTYEIEDLRANLRGVRMTPSRPFPKVVVPTPPDGVAR
jgi:uncharacterized tellurite resistance protein B-like protein